jgi:type IV secretory pathway ATPase VirB11/archaellum biosynthesis ATPase
MQNNTDLLLQHLLEGHRVIAKMHGDSPGAACQRMVGRMEMHKRGVRFLPAQVIKKAVRKVLPAGKE